MFVLGRGTERQVGNQDFGIQTVSLLKNASFIKIVKKLRKCLVHRLEFYVLILIKNCVSVKCVK